MSRRSEIPTTPEGLRKYMRVIDDQDICIGCGACVSVCPTNAWELDENGKARLIWDWCIDDFSCIPVCPVNCIWKTPESPETARPKDNWYRFSRQLTPEEQKVFEEWAKKYGITGKPAKVAQ
ncbi:indolepyruvate ferredoxin oxidoreductase subunit alpha [Caldivirga sp. UBA161]|uniref:indolepyruvate ferredoxin oxidoreductase subunit alpha n=1 Tax=Caldivirga sp. UBA161 TaxID=1915569 RepID=UPI0025C736C4|nr:4Fe-4S binding protein [Caldivirga sp. UBA161]